MVDGFFTASPVFKKFARSRRVPGGLSALEGMKTKSKSSAKKKPTVRVRDLTPSKDTKGGIKGESGDSKHKDEIEVLSYRF
jgi:hypothetical protein